MIKESQKFVLFFLVFFILMALLSFFLAFSIMPHEEPAPRRSRLVVAEQCAIYCNEKLE